ncbi:MAG: DeoR family transcriptional regulator [Bacteroidaceae bacterium]|nr:DeoR family transcriptional regulator [Bacteroidaceae bacterium]
MQSADRNWTNECPRKCPRIVLETSASLATHFKVDVRTIRRDLSILQTKGFIRHDEPDKGGRWVVIKG